jgi:RND family efflux transporter MFP subunit
MHARTVLACLFATLAAGAACTRPTTPAAEPAELPTLDITHWTLQSELFMEHPPLVAGRTVRFAVHLTTLADFSALSRGRPRIEMTPDAGGATTTVPGSDALRPGAFRVEGALPAAGRYRWALVVDAPGLQDRHDLGTTTVFADEAAAVAAAGKEPSGDPTAIAYLKEQQWTSPFATAIVGEAPLRTVTRVPAQIAPLAGGDAVVAAPAAGRFEAEALLAIGTMVRQGQVLGRIEPRLADADGRTTLAASVDEAQAGVDAATADTARAERLLAEQAVPQRRVDDARRAQAVAEARLRAARARLAQRDETLRAGGGAAAGNAFVLRSPIAGRLTDVDATLGAAYQEGATLFRVVRTDEVELQVLVAPADVPRARGVSAIALELSGRDEPLPLRFDHRHDSGVLDAATRALTIQFDVDNRAGHLLIGQSGTALLYGSVTAPVPAVPKAAVLTEAGRPYVFVQAGGETFVRRFVTVSAREGDLVGLASGVSTGERVVTKGAYDIQLASAAKGLPAEGHVH